MRGRAWICSTLALVLAGAGCGSPAPGASGNGGGFGTQALGVTLGDVIYLVGVPSGRCLNVAGGSAAEGAALELRDCSGAASQQLRLETADGYYVLRVVGSDKCLAVSGASTSAGASVVQETCSGAASQGWSGADVGGAYRVTSRASGMAIDAYGAGTANGTKIIQWPENGGTNQQWRVVAASEAATYTVTIAASGSGTTSPGPGTYTVQAGTAVTVTATPASGATFTGWSGAATGTTNPVTIAMDANKTLTASFSSGGGTCSTPSPPAAYAPVLQEVWNHTSSYVLPFRNYAWDQIAANGGTINYCVRWESSVTVTPAMRDQIAAMLDRQLNKWIARLAGYDCWPYDRVPVKVVGWAVRDRSTLAWTDDSVPVYVNDIREGAPQCAESCGRFFHQDGNYSGCPGGAANHYDMSLWLTEGFGGGHGGDWGQRVGRAYVTDNVSASDLGILLHEMGHSFGLDDFYDWTGTPLPACVMVAGSSMSITDFDGWMLRDVWSHIKSRLGY